MNILLGKDRNTGKSVHIPDKALERHLHMVGFTGSGKTTAIITLLLQLFKHPHRQRSAVIIDRFGGFSRDLVRWFASDWCPPWVRERLVYIEGANENVTIPMHPLAHATPAEAYYRTARAAEIALRGWDAQDLLQMPRLMRWIFNSMYAVCHLGLAVTDAAHLLFPRSELHKPILYRIPEQLRYEWEDIIQAKGGQAELQLESCRNRLKPFFDCPPLHHMFSSTVSRFDVRRWMAEKKIVILNLAPMGKLPETAADAMGGFTVNEVLSVARSLPPEERTETLLVLDEFQRFVRGSDLEFALAESRQLKISLLLSHQSFSQLKTDNVDLTSLILQAQTRLMLKVAGVDAEILAEELAHLSFDPMEVKHEIWHRSQTVSGHRIVELETRSFTDQQARNWSEQFGTGWTEQQAKGRSTQDRRTYDHGVDTRVVGRVSGDTNQESRGTSGSKVKGVGESSSHAESHGVNQTMVPVYETIEQLASKTFWTLEEERGKWGKKLRQLKRGQGVLQIADDDNLYEVDIQRTALSHLALDWETVLQKIPAAADAYHRLIEQNFKQEWFVLPAQVQKERQERLERVLKPVTEIVEVREQPRPLPPPVPKKKAKKKSPLL